MSKRTDRRAAERAERKLAFEQKRQSPSQSQMAALPSPAPVELSSTQLAANRANAQLSTGPTTSAGKAKSSMNALKHGLTSRTVLLDGEDAAEYQRRFDCFLQTYNPNTDEEIRLVQSLVDSLWRIQRIHQIESAVFFKGKLDFAEQFADQPASRREVLILLETELKYQKLLRNLQTQEARLRRYFEKDQKQLHLLRQQQPPEENDPASAAQAKVDGFVFSNSPSTPSTLVQQAPPSHAETTLPPLAATNEIGLVFSTTPSPHTNTETATV